MLAVWGCGGVVDNAPSLQPQRPVLEVIFHLPTQARGEGLGGVYIPTCSVAVTLSL